MMKRRFPDNYFIVREGILTFGGLQRAVCERPSTEAEIRKFRFSRIGPRGQAPDAGPNRDLAGFNLPRIGVAIRKGSISSQGTG